MKKHITILLGVYIVWFLFLNAILLISSMVPLRIGYVHSFSPWANFDGIHYLEIAKNGYTNNMRFMPLYPLLIALFGFFTNYFWAGLLLSQLSFFAALIFLYKLFCLDYSPKISLISTLAILFFPTSFFYSAIYTEGLFLLLTVLSFYYARKGKWVYAALFGFLSSLTRIVGFLIVIPLLIEYFSQKESKKPHQLCALLAVPLGTMIYSVFNYLKWGNPLLFIVAHSQLSNGRSSTALIFFPQTLYRYFKMLTTVSFSLWEWKIALLEVITFSMAVCGIYFLWRMKVRWSYLSYVILTLLIPASSGTFTGLPRYLIVLFPFLILIPQIKNRLILFILLVCSYTLQIVLFLYFSRGYFVA